MTEQLDIRKSDHIKLAFDSQISPGDLDGRFYYEPVLSGHLDDNSIIPVNFGSKKMHYPIWISSMTGGTNAAYIINTRLAEICGKYRLGMGLGSCRPLLESRLRWADFNLRPTLGKDVPFFANLGIAQVEEILLNRNQSVIEDLICDLDADGLIIHINPLQELLQPEGDRFKRSPLEVITEFLEKSSIPLIVKEVGQGFGPSSMRSLLKLPLLAVDFGSFGGTNFAKLEQLRNPAVESLRPLIYVGHTAKEMLKFVNDIFHQEPECIKTKHLIISGGIKSFLDGFFLINNSPIPSVYGQASPFLKYASESLEALEDFVKIQIKGLNVARAFLSPKPLTLNPES